MKNTFKISALLLAMTIVGCTTPQVIHYKTPDPTSGSNAHLKFISELDTHTYFSVNDHPEEKCADFKPIGYILNTDSMFLYDKPNKEINIDTPSGQPVAIHSYHKFDHPTLKSSCFPPRQLFTPEAGGNYEVRMGYKALKGSDGICFIAVNKVSEDGAKTPVRLEKFGFCDTKTNTLTKAAIKK